MKTFLLEFDGVNFIRSLPFLDITRIGDNKKVSQVEMLPDEQLLVLISGKVWQEQRKEKEGEGGGRKAPRGNGSSLSFSPLPSPPLPYSLSLFQLSAPFDA